MTLDSPQDLLFLVLSIAAAWIAVFVCWVLYEVGSILHQGNRVIAETREKINRVERSVLSIKERLESSVSYLGLMAEGGKSLIHLLQSRQTKKEKTRPAKKKNEE